MTYSRTIFDYDVVRDRTEARLTAVSGVGGKRPACFLVEAGGTRLLLDLGEGPEPGVRPDLSTIDRPVDAILLSHAHEDHANALDLRTQIGFPPVYATEETWALLPETLVPHSDRRLLPDRGSVDIAGVKIETGRSGHAPGGVWIHLAVGDGLLYTGDFTDESHFYPFDPPPTAATLVVDASYGDHDHSLDEQIDEIAERVRNGAVLPVPEGGRGPEMAARLMQRGLPKPYLCEPLRQQTKRIIAGDDKTVSAEARQRLSSLFEDGFCGKPAKDQINICADSNCANGESAELLRTWGLSVPFIFTGHVPKGTPAAELLAKGDARWVRWNVHPRRNDVISLVRGTNAQQIILAFVDRGLTNRIESELSDRTFIWSGDVALTVRSHK